MSARDREFGVEIEFHFQGVSNNVDIAEALLESTPHIPNEWANNIGCDGSGCEIRSPILQGNNGFAQLRAVMELLRENGGVTNASDGLHIHHNAPDYMEDLDAVWRLVESWDRNRRHIERFVHSRRARSGAAPAWRDNDKLQLLAYCGKMSERERERHIRRGTFYGSHYPAPCRNDLNVNSLEEHGTVEFRLHEGTLDYDRAEAWIKFGQYFLDRVIRTKRPLTCVDGPATLLRRIRIQNAARERLMDRTRPRRPVVTQTIWEEEVN